ncbi:enoyl-CoA hydratase/isomerase family protein [Chloroflexota bacterium]
MGEDYVLYEKDAAKRLVRLTFNRPDKLNAMTTAQGRELKDKIEQAEQDDDVKVIIFRGAGSCFGTGMDVAELGSHHGHTADHRPPSQKMRLRFDKHETWGRDGLYTTIARCDKPTIAQVHGYCYGGHLHMLLCCDMVVAAEDALFAHPGWRYLGPGAPMVTMILLMGLRRAKEWEFTGRRLTAQEAVESGLVNKVVPLGELDDTVTKLAEVISLEPMDGLIMGKFLFEIALDMLGAGAFHNAYAGLHAWKTNLRYEADEFSLFKAKKDSKTITEALKKREKHFAESPLAASEEGEN